jgi:hypothetical protein
MNQRFFCVVTVAVLAVIAMQARHSLVDSLIEPDGDRIGLTRFTTNPGGAAVAQAIGPLRAAVATADGGSGKPVDQRYLVLIAIGSDQPVLQQQTL